MKTLKLILTFLLISSFAFGQSSVGISNLWIPATMSTYTTPITGTTEGVQLDYRQDVTYKEFGAFRWLGISQVTVKASYVDASALHIGQVGNVFGKDFNLLFGAGGAINVGPMTKIYWSPEIGLQYTTKDFYNTGNRNEIVGSKLNVIVGASFTLVQYITHDIGFELGGNLWHVSNMKTQQPNVGRNYYLVTAGIVHPFGFEDNGKVKADNGLDFTSCFEISAVAGYQGAVKAGYYVNPKTGKGLYPDTAIQGKTPGMKVEVFSFGYNYWDSNCIALRLGVDVIHRDKTLDYDHLFETYQGPYSSYKHWNAGIYGGIGFQIGRINLAVNEGFLAVTSQIANGNRLYTAIEGKFTINEHFGILVRSQLNDFGSAGLAVNF